MRIDYMTSDKPTSGFTYRGIVADQPPINNNNNHACEFEFKGAWYHAYHNRIVAKEAGIPTGFRRNIAIERLDYESDGSIKKVKYTVDGMPQVGRLDPYTRVEGETFNAQHGIKTEPCTAGGMDLCDLGDGAWIKLKGVDFGSQGARKFSATVASGGQGGNIELRLGGPDGALIGTCAVGNTGGWQSWKTANCPVSNAIGVQDLCLKFTGAGTSRLSLDFWIFE